MKVLVISESAFGNTRAVAEAIAQGAASRGAAVEVLGVADAPASLPGDVDVLVLAAPTHSGGLSTARTRAIAAKQGGRPPSRGIREWIDGADPSAAIVTFAVGTTTNVRGYAGSAAKAAAKTLAARGFPQAQAVEFLVAGAPPVLADGERDRAVLMGEAIVTGEPLPGVQAPAVPAGGGARPSLWRRLFAARA